MPEPTGWGVPQPGDRSARDTHNYADLHASDIEENEHLVHLPLPGAAGGLAQSDGTYWQRVDGSSLLHSRAHTLDSEADHTDVENSAKADGRVLVWRAMAAKHVYEDQSGTGGGGGGYSLPAGFAASVGDGVNVTFDVVHSLGTFDVFVQVYDTTPDPTEQVGATVEIVDADTVRVTFEAIPTSNQYRVLVIAADIGVPNTITVKEADNVPTVTDVDTIIFPASSVTDNLDGSVTIAFPAAYSLENHTHAGVAGDGGTFDAANLTSGAATVGQLLTADGSGNSAWESPAALSAKELTTRWEPLTNGNATTPELIFADGDCVMVEVLN